MRDPGIVQVVAKTSIERKISRQMVRPNNRWSRPTGSSSGSSSTDGGSTCSSDNTGDPPDSPGVGYDGIPSFNVTVSLQPKSPLRAASHPAVGARNSASTTTKQSAGSAFSCESRSLGSASTVVSQTPSLAESIGNFDAETFEAEAKKGVVSEKTDSR